MAKTLKQINSDVIMLKFGQVSPDIKVSTPSWEEGTVRNENSYVPFGPTNRFPNELYALIQQSPTASSIISGTVELIKRYSINENYNLPCYPYINNKHDSIESLVENLVTDYMMFGMIRIQEKLEAARNDSNERKAIREKLERARKKQQIQEKLERARNSIS